MHVDFKITTWERAKVPDGLEEKVIEACKKGIITTVDNLNTFINSLEPLDDFIDWEVLPDVVEYLDLEDNNHNATIEVFSEEIGQIDPIWTNSL